MNWWNDYFDATYPQRYALNSEQTVAEVLMLRDLLPEPPADLLDLACGQGRHSINLARAGFTVIGLDASEPLLDLARTDAAAAAVEVDFVAGDMRAIPYSGCFDAVINMFTAFGYFDREEENQAVLEGIARALKPGGRLIMELAHRDRVVTGFQPTDWYELDDGTVVWIRRYFDPLRGILTSIDRWRDPDGHEDERIHRIRIYTATELDRILRQANLTPINWYGSINLHALTPDSPRIIVVATR
ncbi:methyltransferase domain-containing protein [Candidatus Chloroploca sp. M-50]|uniref:Methyltransferase domain-containing protein n=1 Tax=Candidatus Chloroploca mongolica TaxID=2528176 RepID=A0ABS4D5D4_9CHLR|nr:class I SAM-dependent methyltransferase [Candidatus Chloroploca mongolica]MBP1464652.1 methyltransferase domain-containing protein [Candidatus Chloroploca mongolica]